MRRAPKAVIAALAVLASASPALAQAPRPLEPLFACTAIAEAEARLACFDREAAALRAGAEAGKVAAVRAEDVEAARRAQFGVRTAAPAPVPGAETLRTEAEPEALTLTIARVVEGRRPLYVMAEEGQRWRQTEPELPRFAKPGVTVTIKKGALGSFTMVGPGRGQAVKVRREP